MEPFVIDKACQAGLRPDQRVQQNFEYMVQAEGGKASGYGFVKPEGITWPLQAVLPLAGVLNWPYPMLYRGESQTLVAARNAIYDVTEWGVATLQKVYNLGDPQTETLDDENFADGADPLVDWTAGGAALNDGVAANGWTYSNVGDSVSHTSGGGVTPLQQVAAAQLVPLVDGHVYRVRFTVTGVLSGDITAKLGTAAGGTYDQSGVYTEDIVCAGGLDFFLVPSNTFAGIVTATSIKEVKEGVIPNGSGPWDIADFGDVWFMSNGTCVVCKLHLYDRWAIYVWRTEAGVYPIIPKAVCNFRNRLLIGGMPAATAYFADADWAELWEAWIKSSPKDIITYKDIAMGPNVVMYSDLSGGDFWDPFVPEMAMLGMPGQIEVDKLKYFYLDKIKTRSIGFIPMRWQGNINRIMLLGGAAVVYGDNGVTAITPQQEEGMAVYNRKELAKVGCAGRGAAGGDDLLQAFTDGFGVVRTTDESLKVVRRGYSEFVTSLTPADIVTTIDPDQRDFRISDGVAGFVMSDTGMGELTTFPTYLSHTSLGLIGAFSPSAGGSNNFEFIINNFDMQSRAIKVIHCIEMAASDVTGLELSVGFKFNPTDVFNWTAWHIATDEGFVYPTQGGTEFQLKVKGTWGTNGRISYIKVLWRIDDKRAIDGYLRKAG